MDDGVRRHVRGRGYGVRRQVDVLNPEVDTEVTLGEMVAYCEVFFDYWFVLCHDRKHKKQEKSSLR